MALFKKKRVDPAEVAALHVELRELRARVESAELVKTQLEGQLKSLAIANQAQLSHAQLLQSEMSEQIENLRGRVEAVAERIGAAEAEARSASERVATVGDRVDGVSVELANQLTELGREIDALSHRSPDTDDQTVVSLRDGQVKLAAEQARYEISFRDDLALLAEQVRQLRGRG